MKPQPQRSESIAEEAARIRRTKVGCKGGALSEGEVLKPMVDALELLKQKSREGYTVSSSVIQFICDEAMEKMKEK